MPRAWFRHESNMRNDPAIGALEEEFGLAGYAIWGRLLELHCQSDDGVKLLRSDLPSALKLRPEWNVDLEAWLTRAAKLKLIRVRKTQKSHANVIQIVARTWTKSNPTFESKEAAAERKRRSRGVGVTVTSDNGHSDVTVTSHGTVRDVRSTSARSRAKATPDTPVGRLPAAETPEQAEARARKAGLLPEDA